MYGEPQFSGRDKSGCSCAHIISQQPPRPNGAAAEPQEGPLKSVPGSIHVASASFSQAMLTLFAQFQRGLGGRPRPASPGWVEPSGAGPRHFIIFLPRVPLAKNRISVPRKSGNYLSKGVRYPSRYLSRKNLGFWGCRAPRAVAGRPKPRRRRPLDGSLAQAPRGRQAEPRSKPETRLRPAGVASAEGRHGRSMGPGRSWTHGSSQSLKGRPGRYQLSIRSGTVRLCGDDP